jgi:hypothetical protein
MNRPIELRFIPKWLGGAITHYKTDYKDFESIVSSHDVDLYRLANTMLKAALFRLGIRDFVMPDALVSFKYSEEDALFALFGPNAGDKKIAEFALSSFSIVPDKYDGIIIVEKDNTTGKQDFLRELLNAVALYRGKEAAYSSDSFRQFLIRIDTSAGESHAVHEKLELENDTEKN